MGKNHWIVWSSRNILVGCVVLTSPIQLWAQSNLKPTGTALATISPPRNTSAAILKMDLERLHLLMEEVNHLTLNIDRMMKQKKRDPRAEAPFLAALGNYETTEAVTVLQGRINFELRQEKPSLLIIETCLKALDLNLKPEPEVQLENMSALMVAAEKALITPEGKQLIAYMSMILDRAVNHGGRSVNVSALFEKMFNTPERVVQGIASMESYLNRHILGQPEVVDAIISLEWETQLYRGTRKLPDVLYLVGAYGTGKDTAAETWADALAGGEGLGEDNFFKLPIMHDHSSEWEVLGSTTGYVGSKNIPRFLEFLVNHSGGRYLFKQVEGDKDVVYRIVQNPDWKGVNLPGYTPPEKAVVFANEFHNWSKANKDLVMKQAFEHGYFKVANPNGGLEKIYVPVHFLVASNEAMELITSTESNGQRIGKPLEFDKLNAKQERVKNDKLAIRRAILATNGQVNQTGRGENAPGISLELLNRIDDRYLIMMRILSPETLKEVVKMKLGQIQSRLLRESGFFNSVDLQWDPEIVDFVQEYDYLAEDNARPMKAKVKNLIEETLLRTVRGKDIVLGKEKRDVALHLGLEKNPDGTHSLVIDYREANGPTRTVKNLIETTIKDRPNAPMSAEQVQKLATLPERLKARVFGVDPIADLMGERMLPIENQKTAKKTDPRACTVFVVVGPSSTGKTELFKALSAEYMGDEEELVTFDFSKIQSVRQFQLEILGDVGPGGAPIPSKFMKAYDRAGGNLLVNFDELANVRDTDLLRLLYDFFREPVMYTFSDNVPRPMGGVVVGVTGNAGIEEYKNVPRNVPMVQQMATWEEISKKINASPSMRRVIMERYFPGPLLSRWSADDVFFFPPHTYKTLKQLAQLKLRSELKVLAKSESRHGWNVTVPNKEAYEELITLIVEEGFNLYDQGASIDAFVQKKFARRLEALLLKNLVPSKSTVVLKFVGKTSNDDAENPGAILFKVFVDGRMEPLDFSIARTHEPKTQVAQGEELLITAYHEAGHNLIRQVFFSNEEKPGMMSILPGVTQIGGEWVVYEGIAKMGDKIGRAHLDRNWFLQNIAVWMAGQVAEQLVTNGSHTAGKADDIKRATNFAHDAILRYGLSSAWGMQAIPPDLTKAEYLASLSPDQQDLLKKETDKFLKEGEALARKYLTLNFDRGLIPLGNLLAEKGIVTDPESEAFYAKAQIVLWDGQQSSGEGVLSRTFKGLLSKLQPTPTTVEKWSLRTDIPRPPSVVNLTALLETRKQELFKEVATPDVLPLGSNAAYLASLSLSECEQLLSKSSAQ